MYTTTITLMLFLGGFSLQYDDEVKKYIEKISEEWIYGIKGESARVLICLKLLKRDYLSNMTEIFDLFLKTFHGIYEQIRSR